MGHYSRAMMPVSERVDRSTSRVPRRLAVTTTVVQLWLLSAYLLIDVLPYFWPHAVLAGWMDDPVGTWLLAIPALLLGFAAFWVAVFDTAVGAALAVTGDGVADRGDRAQCRLPRVLAEPVGRGHPDLGPRLAATS
jgi:hypothetical protein